MMSCKAIDGQQGTDLVQSGEEIERVIKKQDAYNI